MVNGYGQVVQGLCEERAAMAGDISPSLPVPSSTTTHVSPGYLTPTHGRTPADTGWRWRKLGCSGTVRGWFRTGPGCSGMVRGGAGTCPGCSGTAPGRVRGWAGTCPRLMAWSLSRTHKLQVLGEGTYGVVFEYRHPERRLVPRQPKRLELLDARLWGRQQDRPEGSQVATARERGTPVRWVWVSMCLERCPTDPKA